MSSKYEDEKAFDWMSYFPNNWKITKIKWITNKVGSGITPKGGAEVYIAEGIPLIRSKDVHFRGLDLTNLAYISEEINEMMSNSKVEPEDVLLNITGASIGRCCVVPKDLEKANVNQHVCILRPINKKIISQFLNFILSSNIGQNQVFLYQSGTSREGLNMQNLKNFHIPLPTILRQKEIIKFLNQKMAEIDALIANKQKMVQLLHEYRQTLISEAVIKGLDSNAEMKDSGIEWIGEIPRHWGLIRLKYLAIINPQKNYSNFSKDSEELVTFLPMERVNEDGTYDINLKKKIKKLWKGFTYFEENDVIVAKITPCFENKKGACLENLGTKFGFGSTEFHVLREVNSKSISKFLYYITKSNLFLDMGESLMTGAAGQKRVPTGFIKNFIVTTPPLEEQKQIADFLDQKTSSIDSIILNIQNQTKELYNYRQSLISEAVNGKIDVRNHN